MNMDTVSTVMKCRSTRPDRDMLDMNNRDPLLPAQGQELPGIGCHSLCIDQLHLTAGKVIILDIYQQQCLCHVSFS